MLAQSGRPLGVAFAVAALWIARAAAAEEPEPEVPSPAPVVATPPGDLLNAAKLALEQGEFDRATELAAQVDITASESLQVEALAVRALALLQQGNRAAAEPLIARLYRRAPAYILDDPRWPPDLLAPFEAEGARPHARAVVPRLREHGTSLRGYAIVAGGDTASVVLRCRPRGARDYVSLTTVRKGSLFRFHIPSAAPYECHATVLDRDGLPLGRLGTPVSPVRIDVRRPRPIEEPAPMWWPWVTGAGLIVSGAVTAIVVFVATDGRDAPVAEMTLEPRAAGWSMPVWRW